MDAFRERGATILFVTHVLENAKEIFNRAVWLSEGRVMDIGPARHVVDQYIKG